MHTRTLPSRPLLLEPGFPYGEDLLQFIWASRLFEHHALWTTDGRPVEVLKPGRIQGNSGPDLLDALLRIDGQLWAGTVEVHLRSSEWQAHGHQHDPAYENVVLHVVYEHDAPARTVSGRELPTVELLPRVPVGRIATHHALMRGKGFVPCAALIAGVDRARLGPWLERVLIERLERKTLEVESLFRQLGNDPAETVYHMLARAFGLKVNAESKNWGAAADLLKMLLPLDPPDKERLLEQGRFCQAQGMTNANFVAYKFMCFKQLRPIADTPSRCNVCNALFSSAAVRGLSSCPLCKHGKVAQI